MRTKKEQWDDAISLMKKLNKYTGTGLYMLKHGPNAEDDDLMLELAQKMIEGIQTMTTVEVCKIDEDEFDDVPEEEEKPKANVPPTDIDQNDVEKMYKEYMSTHCKDVSFMQYDLDCEIFRYICHRLEGNWKTGINIEMNELCIRFYDYHEADITDSITRLMCGYYVDEYDKPIYAITGFMHKNNNIMKNIWINYAGWHPEVFYNSAKVRRENKV